MVTSNKNVNSGGTFLIMKRADDTKDLKKVLSFLIEKGISIIASSIKITKVHNSGIFLLETSSGRQTKDFLKTSALGGIVSIQFILHPYLNTTKGLIYWEDLMEEEDEFLLEQLISQKVIDIKRVKRLGIMEIMKKPLLTHH